MMSFQKKLYKVRRHNKNDMRKFETVFASA